jgi:2-dehydropantoate 2-reductase
MTKPTKSSHSKPLPLQSLPVQRIAIVGPGSIGCCIAAALMERGHEVIFVARSGFDQLLLEGPDGKRTFPARCTTEVKDLEGIDLLVLTTKAHQTATVAPYLLKVALQGVPIFVVQNGVDQVERTEAILRAESPSLQPDELACLIVPAVVYCSAHRRAPGHAVREGQAKLILPKAARGEHIASLFESTFVEIQLSNDWTSAAWGKLLMNASIGALCVLARRNMDVLHDAQAAELAVALMKEIIAVGRAAGARFSDDAAQEVLQGAIRNSAGHMPSIAQDRLAGLPTEWVARNDVVVRLGARYGVAVPLNAAMTTLANFLIIEAKGF